MQEVVAAAARHGIAVTPASEFSVSRGNAPDTVRRGPAAPSTHQLAEALGLLASLASGDS